MNSDKFVTIGITATKDVRKAMDMLKKELSGGHSFKALFERMLSSYGNAQIAFFKRAADWHSCAIEENKKQMEELNRAASLETDSKERDKLFSKLVELESEKKHYTENYWTNQEMVDFYSRFLSTAFPSKAYPDEINDKDVMFRG